VSEVPVSVDDQQSGETPFPKIYWKEGQRAQSARWRSESGLAAPKKVLVVDDTLKADTAFHYACEGTAMLWRGDFQNAKLLLQAMARRADNRARKEPDANTPLVPFPQAFHLHRQAQSQRARMLAMVLIPMDATHSVSLRRAPDVQLASYQVHGKANEPYIISLREVLGIIGGHEWRKAGIPIQAAQGLIHPHYGVFAPVRNEYVDLVATTPLSPLDLAFDVGTGTGVLAAVLARRGVKKIVATETSDRALACAQETMVQLHLTDTVEVVKADMFPTGRAPLVVCNPPWIPARASSPLEGAIYDHESRMLKAFLAGLSQHLTAKGEGWLILSDIAEHLGLRVRSDLLSWIEKAGLKVLEKRDIKPTHPRARDAGDPLYRARQLEVTSLWRLGASRLAGEG